MRRNLLESFDFSKLNASNRILDRRCLYLYRGKVETKEESNRSDVLTLLLRSVEEFDIRK